ncbi:MAG: hypothetical protein WD059_12080 [Balneolaceae bacterium]
MKKISEHIIEQYIRFPQELSLVERKEVSFAIKHSQEAKKIYSFLKEYYQEFDRLFGVQTNIIPLQVAEYKNDKTGPVVLAAMTPETTTQVLKTKAILVSEERKTLVRILENQLSHSLQFHIISEQKNQVERAILSLVHPEMDLVTDENGKLKNVRELSDVHWESVSTLLRLPVEKITLDTDGSIPHALQNVLDSEMTISQKKNKLELNVINADSKLTRVLAVNGEHVVLQHFEEQKAEIDLADGDITGGSVTLYFYE